MVLNIRLVDGRSEYSLWNECAAKRTAANMKVAMVRLTFGIYFGIYSVEMG